MEKLQQCPNISNYINVHTYIINNVKWHSRLLICGLDHRCFVGNHVEEEKQLGDEEDVAYLGAHI